MKIFASCLSISVAALVLNASASAATLVGNIKANGRPLESAVVSLYFIKSPTRKFVTVTNASGAYRFVNVLNGAHVVIIDKDGRRLYQGTTDVQKDAATFDVNL